MKQFVLIFIFALTTCLKGRLIDLKKCARAINLCSCYVRTGNLLPRAQRFQSRSIWTRLNSHPVCFHAQGDHFGLYKHVLDGRLVGAIKLEHVWGFVRCTTNPAYNSYWGCYHFSSLLKFPLNVIITDSSNNIIFPLSKYIRHNAGLWYYLPNTDARFSKELVFSNYMDPFYLPKGGFLRIWYGEDLTGWNEHDNQGKVCVNVYAHGL